MTHDPFDRLRDANPVPGDAGPAPMQRAEEIMAGRSVVRGPGGWPGWAVAAAAAAAVLVAGGAWMLWLGPGGAGTAATDPATTAAAPSSTTAPATSEPAPTTGTTNPGGAFPDMPSELAVYMLMDADSTHLSPGPLLVPASWTTAILSAPLTDAPRQAIEWLLRGPLPGWEEGVPTISTAIPGGTRLLGLEIADGVATVNLSEEFVSGGGTLSMTARVAQVVFTLTRFEEIDGVRFLVEGIPTTVFGGEGIVVDDPATRAGFEDLLPPIMIETPMYGAFEGSNPLHAEGTANVFEGTVSLALAGADGRFIWEGFTTATCGTGCRGVWSIDIPYTVDEDQRGWLMAWEESAADGHRASIREHPVWLVASGEPAGAACSGGDVPDELPQQDLPDAVEATRRALFAAARSCDWAALEDLSSGALLEWGSPLDRIDYYRQREAAGHRPMWWLAQTLRLPGRGDPAEGPDSVFVWPWIFGDYTTSPTLPGAAWTISESDRALLLEIYTPEQIASFEEFGGFIGYRIGIEADGTWRWFVAGD